MLTKEYLECLLDYCQLQDKSGALIDGLSPGVMIEIITRLIQAEKDAARYRWLRDDCKHGDWHTIGASDSCEWDLIVDGCIDEAMQCQ